MELQPKFMLVLSLKKSKLLAFFLAIPNYIDKAKSLCLQPLCYYHLSGNTKVQRFHVAIILDIPATVLQGGWE